MTTLAPRIDKIEDPTLQTDDSLATRLGQKPYRHGTTYNSGLAPTVTLSSGGGSINTVRVAEFVPCQMQDGSWRVKFNIEVNLTSTSRTTITLAIAGITFFNTSGDGQAITGYADATSIYVGYALANPNAGTIIINHVSSSTTTYTFSGDVKLASKPTWAY